MCSLHCQPGQGTWGQEGVGNWDQVWWLQGWSSSSLLAHWTPQGSQDCIQTKASSPLQYADPVTDLLDRCGVFRARLFRESCVFHQGCYVKDLSRLGRDLRKTLILDNSPASYIFHPENAVPVQSWFDDMADTELLNLIPIFEELSGAEDVYTSLGQLRAP